ncbi:ABC transporter permease [Sinosporangium siamense]|uniref:Peptide ABC transporter permease n=1 Tax=Sinosporangium siamense TaxID=1367973 RepID=A0A919RPA4_9ACTN|nr:ABC transporter permease [Sinosporangium siamense]GII97363.1 peptide ABC transporter permease [Sinosporangium siamense]
MTRFLLRRAATSALVLLGVMLATFLLARVVPASPAVAYIGPKAQPADIARVERELGLDQPLHIQFWRYLSDMLTGDWGDSIGTKQPVLQEIGTRLPATLELLIVAMVVAVAVGLVLGVIAARRKGTKLDHLIRLLSIGGVSMPAFWLGLLLQVVFVRALGLLPPTGRLGPETPFVSPITELTGLYTVDALLTGNMTAFGDAFLHILLPAATLAAYPAGVVARMTRATMIETLSQDHVRTARAYGLAERTVTWRIALRNALPPVTTVFGLTLAYSLTGTFFVEVVFNWPGLGQFAAQALLNVDYPAIMGVTVLGAVGYVLVNLVVDLIQARLDPRVGLA